MAKLHLMTQRSQPYGSERRCCERCGLMMVGRPETFWKDHAYVDDEQHFHDQKHRDGRDFVRCDQPEAA